MSFNVGEVGDVAQREVSPHSAAGDKARQILNGARRVFMQRGFDGASMNEIARVAEVSKGTLYVYFSSKAELFSTLIREDRVQLLEPIFQFDMSKPDIRAVLNRVGSNIVRATLTSYNISYLRMVMSVAAKMPEVGRAYYESGLEYCIARIAAYLQEQNDAGLIAIDECRLAAAQFLQACHGDNLLRVLFCVSDSPGEEEIKSSVERAVDLLLAYYPSARGFNHDPRL